MELTSITPTPQMLRALAHPTRLTMLGMLRIDGPATATSLATRLGINTGQTSYHLRQLAHYGFVVDYHVRVTAEHAEQLTSRMHDIFMELNEDADDDPDAVDFVFQFQAFPRPGH